MVAGACRVRHYPGVFHSGRREELIRPHEDREHQRNGEQKASFGLHRHVRRLSRTLSVRSSSVRCS